MSNDQTDTNDQDQAEGEEGLDIQASPLIQETGGQSVDPQTSDAQPEESLDDAAKPAIEETPVNAAPAVIEPPKVEPKVVVEVQKTTTPEPTEGLSVMLAAMRKDGSASQKGLIYALDTYVERMAPGKPMDAETGAKHQHALWKAVQNVIESSPDGEFKRLWSILLAYAEEHKNGVFGDRYLFRFADQWHQSESELTAFQRAMNLVRLTSNPRARAKGLKQVDLQRSLEETFTEQGRARVLGFYQ